MKAELIMKTREYNLFSLLSKSDTTKVVLWALFLSAMRLGQVYGIGNQTVWSLFALIIVGISACWPLGGLIAILSLFIIGDTQIVFGFTLSLLLRLVLPFRLIISWLSERKSRNRNISLSARQHVIRNWIPFAVAVILAWMPIWDQTGEIDFIEKFLLTFLLLCSLVYYINSTRALYSLSLALVVIGMIDGLAIIWGGPARTYYRAVGLLGSENYTATYLACLIPMAFAVFKRKILSVFGVFCLGIGTLLTVSRGGIIVAGIAVFVFFLLNAKDRQVTGFVLLMTILLVLWGARGILSPKADTRIISSFSALLSGSQIDPTTNRIFDRFPLWQDSVRIWRSHPLLGVGPLNWFASRLEFAPNATTEIPHMYVGQLIAETGSLGAITFFWFVVVSLLASFRKCNTIKNKEIYILCTSWLAGGVAFVLSIFSGYVYNPYFHGFLIIAGIAPFLSTYPFKNGNLVK